MKKKLRNATALFLLLVLAFSAVPAALGASAPLPDFTQTQQEWDGYWEAVKDEFGQIALTPGADETELNFAWCSKLAAGGAAVRIGRSPDLRDARTFYASFRVAAPPYRTNLVTVTGLEENTVYYYTYGTDGTWSEPAMYRTGTSNAFEALFVTDVQISSAEKGSAVLSGDARGWDHTLNTALSTHPDIRFVLSGGDQTNSGNHESEYAAFLAPPALRSLPVATAVGNHDWMKLHNRYHFNNPNEVLSPINAVFGRDYYFAYGNALFIVLDTNNHNALDHYDAVKAAVQARPDAMWRIVVMHHDIYGPGHHADNEECTKLRKYLVPVFDKFEIDAVLTGHDHAYARSYQMKGNEIVQGIRTQDGKWIDPEGTVYFTGGSASASKFYDWYDSSKQWWLASSFQERAAVYTVLSFEGNSLTFKAYRTDTNTLIDSPYTIEKMKQHTQPEEETRLEGWQYVMEEILGPYAILVETVFAIAKFVLQQVFPGVIS